MQNKNKEMWKREKVKKKEKNDNKCRNKKEKNASRYEKLRKIKEKK